MNDQHNKISSVLELARYRVGDVAWWVIFRQIEIASDLTEEDSWMQTHHPKVLYTRGSHKHLWKSKAALPKLQHIDFLNVMSILTSKCVVEQFTVCDVLRSRYTGEFFYANDNNEWIPESNLLSNKAIANQEKSRMMKLMKKWINTNKEKQYAKAKKRR